MGSAEAVENTETCGFQIDFGLQVKVEGQRLRPHRRFDAEGQRQAVHPRGVGPYVDMQRGWIETRLEGRDGRTDTLTKHLDIQAGDGGAGQVRDAIVEDRRL